MTGGDEELTRRQQDVVNSSGNCFVEACPGAGKTRTMVALFMKVVTSLPPRHGAVVVSYTNCAADEIRARCARAARPDLCDYPHFVGTFDAFIDRFLVVPFGSRWAEPEVRVRIVEAWGRLGVEVPVWSKNGKRLPVPLDAFPLNGEGQTELDLTRVPPFFRAAVEAQADRAIAEARKVRQRLHEQGYLSCDDARVCAALRLRDPTRGAGLLSALAARFRSLIIDEAQDCSPVDLEILSRLRDAGIRTVAVADPNQAIFRFRGADAKALADFAAPMQPFTLAENFRSSQIICHLTSSLRHAAAADQAVGRDAADRTPILLLPYEGKGGSEVGDTFSTAVSRFQMAPLGSIVLAHQLATALRATGRPAPPAEGASGAFRLADAVLRFKAASHEPRALLSAVRVVERLLLTRLGVKTEQVLPEHAAEEQAIDVRWLRAEALRLLGRLGRLPLEDTPDRRWIEAARTVIASANAPTGFQFQRSPQQILPDRAAFVLPADPERVAQSLPAATVHSVKGREYDGVLVVLPNEDRTDEVIQAWEGRADHEARSVLYVATTRARRLLGLAMPSRLLARLHQLASRDGATCEVVAVLAPPPDARSPPLGQRTRSSRTRDPS